MTPPTWLLKVLESDWVPFLTGWLIGFVCAVVVDLTLFFYRHRKRNR